MFSDKTRDLAGSGLAISGTLISAMGTLINNCYLDHVLSIKIWFFSNPIMLVYFLGLRLKKWNGTVSIDFIIGLYLFFSITNTYAIYCMLFD